ncbi:hypothetical protein Glove_177g7 [Diversispora epigaea]|uniref:Uncharacterized protein n=2 Tax=Diversispora epigaea TaxID=1348612 RepID=A0A397IT76_9GLOM|nr:hypothetical protein Glove_177g7 [Diversispora epigaea]
MSEIQKPDIENYITFLYDGVKGTAWLAENFAKLPEEYRKLVENIGGRQLGPSYDGFQLMAIAVWLKNEDQYTSIDYWLGTSNLNAYYKSNALNELIKKRNQLQTVAKPVIDTSAAKIIDSLSSNASELASIIASQAKTNNSCYVKLIITNSTPGDFYLAKRLKSNLNIMEPTIMKGTSATYLCESEHLGSLSAQMQFWGAKDLYSTGWSDKAFCVSISNGDSSRLLVHECTSSESLEDVVSGKVGKQRVNLTNDAIYSGFHNSYIYASVSSTKSKNIEINLQIGGNPFSL